MRQHYRCIYDNCQASEFYTCSIDPEQPFILYPFQRCGHKLYLCFRAGFPHSSSVISIHKMSLQALSIECKVAFDLLLSTVSNNGLDHPHYLQRLSVSESDGSLSCDITQESVFCHIYLSSLLHTNQLFCRNRWPRCLNPPSVLPWTKYIPSPISEKIEICLSLLLWDEYIYDWSGKPHAAEHSIGRYVGENRVRIEVEHRCGAQ